MEQSQSPEYSERRLEQENGLQRCATHLDIETRLACGRCGKYICPRCLIQTSVGSRCNECAHVTTHPTFDVRPTYYLRAGAAGGSVAVVAGLIWGLVIPLGFVFLGIGLLVGEAVSRASNRKRGQGLAIIAGVSMVLAVIAAGYLPSWNSLGILSWLMYVGGAVYIAINRVR